jgi:hypothetical protein
MSSIIANESLIKGLIVLTVTASLTPSFGQEAKQGIGIIGIGNSSCGLWTSSRSGQDAESFAFVTGAQGWIHGFITAMAVESDKVNAAIHRTDPKGLDAWIDNWCKANPLKTIARAAGALAVELTNQ